MQTTKLIKRYKKNPILEAKDIPYDATLIFNAGVVKYQGKYIMVFRNDYNYTKNGPFGFEGTNLGLAFSEDGIHWDVQKKPCFTLSNEEIIRAYDPKTYGY